MRANIDEDHHAPPQIFSPAAAPAAMRRAGLFGSSRCVSFTVSVAPPMLPVYEQPPLPEPGYLWTPGYWAWDGMDYFWVPGTWVQPPVSDMLWTPGYWGWRDGFYGWNPGYWGNEVGYYGGVNYCYGYTGVGYQVGYWHGGAFFYNRSVANFGRVNVVNVYNAPIQVHERSRISFNGGQGGLRYRPNAAERTAMNERHREPTPMQRQHQQRAASMPALHLSQNGGRPEILTTQRAADFAHPGPGLHNHAQIGAGARAPTAAPQRAEGEQRAQGEQRAASEQRALGEQRAQGEQRALGEQRAQGEQRALGEQRAQGEQRAASEQRARGDQRASGEQPHVAGPGAAMRGPGPNGVAPQVRGGPPPGQAPRPQVSHEQPRQQPAPKREEPKHESEPKH